MELMLLVSCAGFFFFTSVDRLMETATVLYSWLVFVYQPWDGMTFEEFLQECTNSICTAGCFM